MSRSKHTRVDYLEDLKEVLATFLDYNCTNWDIGRWLGGSLNNPVEIKQAIDLFTTGEHIITRGDFVDKLMEERLFGVRVEDGMESEDERMLQEEEQWIYENYGHDN